MESSPNFSLIEIQTNLDYFQQLNSQKGTTIQELISYAHTLSPELNSWCTNHQEKLKISSLKDKGAVGKIIEFHLFGNVPNNQSIPDTLMGDIKVTHLKKIKKEFYNAKERLTITNIGNEDKDTIVTHFIDKNSFQETKFWEKMQSGILFFLEEGKINTIEDLYHKPVFGIIRYDLNELLSTHSEIATIIQTDFTKIKNCIIDKKVSQKGQQYIHVHKHGGKHAKTRALGFTNKFVTLLYSIYMNTTLIVKGRSHCIVPLQSTKN